MPFTGLHPLPLVRLAVAEPPSFSQISTGARNLRFLGTAEGLGPPVVVAEQAAPWAHASSVLVSVDDALDDGSDDQRPAEARSPERITPDDMQAVAFHGLLRRYMRGPTQPGQEAQVLAANLRKLADAIEAFDADPPGSSIEVNHLRELARRTPRDR